MLQDVRGDTAYVVLRNVTYARETVGSVKRYLGKGTLPCELLSSNGSSANRLKRGLLRCLHLKVRFNYCINGGVSKVMEVQHFLMFCIFVD